MLAAVVVVVVILLAVVVWRAGAFGARTDREWPVAPGATVTAGPYELTFTKMTVQKKKDYDDKRYVEAIAYGTGRTTADESLVPRYSKNNGMLLARDLRTRTTADPERLQIGDRQSGTGTFTPGLPPTSVAVTFRFAGDFEAQDTLALAIIDQEFRDNSLLGDQDPEWRNGTHYYSYLLPVTRLPDDLS